MQNRQTQHTHGVPTSPALASSIKNVSCDSCLLHKAIVTLRNTIACAKPSRPRLNMSSDIWGPMNAPSPHGLRYCLLVIDHHTHYMWVRFLKTKDDACSELETILLDSKHLHARHHSHFGAFAPVLTFDSDYVFEAAATRQMCARLGVSVQFSAPMPITCSAKLNSPCAPSGTTLLRCSTVWPSPIPCGHALSALLCTFATAKLKLKLFTTCTLCAGLHQLPYAPVAVSGPSQLCHTRNLQVRARPLTN
jgi:hypothetical protein